MYIQYCPDVYYTGPTSNQHWLNDSSRWRSSLYMVLIRAPTAITFRKTAYFCSMQLPLFAFARQRIGGDKLLLPPKPKIYF